MPRRRLGLIIVLGALTAFGPMSTDMYLPAFPVLARHFSASAPQVQLTVTASLAGLGIGQLLAGPVSDALGRRRPLFAGLIAFTVASALCAVAPNIYVLIGLRFIQGLGGAAGLVISRAVVRDTHEGAAIARFFSVLMLVNGLAPMLAPLLGAELLRFASWPAVFVVLTLYGAGLVAGVAVVLPETLPPDRRRTGGLADTGRAFRHLATERDFLGYVLSGGLAFAAMFGYISASSFVIQDVYRMSAQVYGLIFGLNALGIVVAGQLNARLVGPFGPRRMLSVMLGVHLACGLAVLAAVGVGGRTLGWLLPPLFLSVASNGFLMPNTTALALAGHANVAGTASALLGMVQFALGAVVAPLVGLGGTASALPMAIVIATASLAANLVFRTLSRRRPAERIEVPRLAPEAADPATSS